MFLLNSSNMLRFLPGTFRGIIAMLLIAVNSLIFGLAIMVFTAIKALVFLPKFRQQLSKLTVKCASLWSQVCLIIIHLSTKIDWVIQGAENLVKNDWYFLISNHQSWTDIFVLVKVFLNKVPFFKFFLKKELIWIPVIGQVFWALDYPFMKRYSKKYLQKHPQLKGKDLETTKRFCEKFKQWPVTVINFPEGSRFTTLKHSLQTSPFTTLLKPKAGGLAFSLQAMHGIIHKLINVTIIYPQKNFSFWDLFTGKIKKVIVNLETISITPDLIGDYENDPSFRKHFQNWLNELWQRKDILIQQTRNKTQHFNAANEALSDA